MGALESINAKPLELPDERSAWTHQLNVSVHKGVG
jgi:hypothetical protein